MTFSKFVVLVTDYLTLSLACRYVAQFRDLTGVANNPLHRLGYWPPSSAWGRLITPPPPPAISRTVLVLESRARRHSKALHKTHQKHLSELKIEVTREVKVRSKVKIRRFDVMGPGNQDYRT